MHCQPERDLSLHGAGLITGACSPHMCAAVSLSRVDPITSKIIYWTAVNKATSATMDGKARAGTLGIVARGRVVLWVADLVVTTTKDRVCSSH